jgi:hypothetical protein
MFFLQYLREKFVEYTFIIFLLSFSLISKKNKNFLHEKNKNMHSKHHRIFYNVFFTIFERNVIRICQVRATSVPSTCYKCAKYVLQMCPVRATNVPSMCYKCAKYVLQMCQIRATNVPSMCYKCAKYVLQTFLSNFIKKHYRRFYDVLECIFLFFSCRKFLFFYNLRENERRKARERA